MKIDPGTPWIDVDAMRRGDPAKCGMLFFDIDDEDREVLVWCAFPTIALCTASGIRLCRECTRERDDVVYDERLSS